MPKYVILGAGVSGLAAALGLARRGETDVLIVEKEHEVGGLCRSFEWEGCTLDFGPHRIHPTIPRVGELIREILADDTVVVPRKSEMVLFGRRLRYPVNPLEVLRVLGVRRSAGLFLSYLGRPFSTRVRNLPSGSYAAYSARSFGWGLHQLLFDGYARKVWHEDPADMDEDVARIRVASGGLLDTIRESFRKDSRHTVSQFLYPRGGIGVLPERMAEEVRKSGIGILTGSFPTRIDADSSGVRSVTLKREGGEETLPCERLISTLPLGDLLAILSPFGREFVRGTRTRLPFSDLRLAFFLLRKPNVTGNSWMYFPDPSLLITRLYEVGNFQRGLVPEGMGCIVVEVHCRRSSEVWDLADEEFLGRVSEDLCKAGLIRGEEWTARGTRRVENAYPLHLLGYRTDLDAVTSRLSALPGVISTGRCGLHCYNNLDHSIEMGLVAAEAAAQPPSQSREFYRLTERFSEFRIID
jgi:protoporphyrinogen oxidase